MSTQNRTSNDVDEAPVAISEEVLKKLCDCKFNWQRSLLLNRARKVSDALFDAFTTEAQYSDSHPVVDDFGNVIPKEPGTFALIVYHCAQQHDDIGYWEYTKFPAFYKTKIHGNSVVFASECKEMLSALFGLQNFEMLYHFEKVEDPDTLIDLTFPCGDRLYLGKRKSEFHKVGEVQYLQLTYLEATTMYLTEEEIQAGKKGYFTNQTQYFPYGELEGGDYQKDVNEAVKAFDMRLNSKYPYRSSKNGYSIEEVKAINNSRKQVAV